MSGGAIRSLVVGTAGHIDHGKSALVTALTGINPDRLKEEQARGITIDLGFAHAEIEGVGVAFVDVPGHERFVRNMLAGAGGIDAVLLVIAADESVMPQTREHFAICRMLGLRRGVIALTKCDLADPDMRDLATLEAAELVAGSPLAAAPIVPVSVVTGEGLDDLRRAIAALAETNVAPARTGVTRLPVDRVFTMKGFGAVVTGTLTSGTLAPGDDLDVLPGARRVRVRGVQVHGRRVDRAVAPCRAAVNLGGVDAADLHRGVTLATTDGVSVTRRVDLAVDVLPDARPLRHGARVRMHHGTSELLGRVSVAALRIAPDEAWTPVAAGEAEVAVPPGASAWVRLRLEQPAVLTRGDLVVFRAYSPPVTIAGGRVLDPEPPRAGVRRGRALDRFRRLDDDRPPVGAWIEESGGQGLDAGALVRRGGLGPEDAGRQLDDHVAHGLGVRAGARVFDAALAGRIRDRIEPALAGYHRAFPLEPGMPREALREDAAPGAISELFAEVLGALVAAGRVGGADRLALPSHRPTVSADEQAVVDRIEAEARAAGLAALDAGALVDRTGAPRALVDRLLGHLVREGRLVRVDAFVVAPEALDQLRGDVTRAAAEAAPARASIDIGVFKARYGLSRRHAIPLLEWLDRERLTRRVGAGREIVADPR